MKNEVGAVGREIVERRPHPEFDPTTLRHDFMVLKLNEKVDTIPSVQIHQDNEVAEGASLSVVGFGSTASRIDVSKIDSDTFQFTVLDTREVLMYGNDDGPTVRRHESVLQKETLSYVIFDDCNADDQFAGFIDNNTMICAGDPHDGGDICFGDAGGPLCMMDEDECIQIGIVSFGTSCAIADRAGVYAHQRIPVCAVSCRGLGQQDTPV